MTINKQNGKIGILVGGGPAPGINGVIHSATIEAINNGLEVVGIYDGFKHLMEGKLSRHPADHRPMSAGSTWTAARSCARRAPTRPSRRTPCSNCVCALLRQASPTWSASAATTPPTRSTASSSYAAGEDGDHDAGRPTCRRRSTTTCRCPTASRRSASRRRRELGTRMVMNFMEDARTSRYWFLVVTMGRKAGHLALGIGKSSGATLTIIPEEWRGERDPAAGSGRHPGDLDHPPPGRGQETTASP